MDAFERIVAFLDAVRRRLRRRHALRAGLLGAAALAGLAALLPLAALLVRPAQGRMIAIIGLGLAAMCAAGVVALGAIAPRRRWRSDHRVARFVGRHALPIASDLLSAVELGNGFGRGLGSAAEDSHGDGVAQGAGVGQGSRGRVSSELTEAFLA